jgi:hypothetical protein
MSITASFKDCYVVPVHPQAYRDLKAAVSSDYALMKVIEDRINGKSIPEWKLKLSGFQNGRR